MFNTFSGLPQGLVVPQQTRPRICWNVSLLDLVNVHRCWSPKRTHIHFQSLLSSSSTDGLHSPEASRLDHRTGIIMYKYALHDESAFP